MFRQKRFYTRETLRSIRITRLDKNFQPFIVIGREPLNMKRVNYLSCIEGKGGGKEINSSAQNAERFVDLS